MIRVFKMLVYFTVYLVPQMAFDQLKDRRNAYLISPNPINSSLPHWALFTPGSYIKEKGLCEGSSGQR